MNIPQEFEDVFSGVELTENELRTLIWITGWESRTVENLRSEIQKVQATALSTLQAENKELRAELEQVKRERDAAVSDLTFVVNQYRLETTGIDLCGLCEYDLPPVGENGQTAECPGFYVNDCFKWQGPEEG